MGLFDRLKKVTAAAAPAAPAAAPAPVAANGQRRRISPLARKTAAKMGVDYSGIAGSGQRELLESIAGLHHLDSGSVTYYNPKKDKPITFYHKTFARVMELASEGMLRYADGTDFTGKDADGNPHHYIKVYNTARTALVLKWHR